MSTQQVTPEAATVQETLKLEDFMEKITDATLRAEMERTVADKYQAYAVRKRPGCDNSDEVQMRIAAGRAFGLDRDTSLACFDVIKGVVAMRASLRGALLQRQGWHWVFGKHDKTMCELIPTLNGSPYLGMDGKPYIVRYTMDDAKNAGLAGKDVWKNYGEDMLFNRALSRLQKRVCPAATLGKEFPDPSEPFTFEQVVETTEEQIQSKSAAKLAALGAELAAKSAEAVTV